MVIVIFYYAGKLEIVNLQKNIAEIQKQITKLEYEVKDFMDDNYVEFSAKLTRDVHLVKKTEQLLKEMDTLQSRINDQVYHQHLLCYLNRVNKIKFYSLLLYRSK